jgi:hypothetical protein
VERRDLVWPPDWQQEAISAALPHVGSDHRRRILVGDPKLSVSGTAIGGYLFEQDGRVMVIYDTSGRPDVYPWPLLSGPVLRIELLRPKKRPVVLFSEAEWEPKTAT